mgnify:CR=1 FL=1
MKKIVEMTYCDRCSTAIALEELESYEGFDLCRPCEKELRRRICIFVCELKVPVQPEVEATIEPVKPPSVEAIPEPELESSPQREPEQVEYNGFLHLKCSGCGATKTFCAKKPMSMYHCYDCGTDTDLTNNMTPVYANCECGKRSRYMTNVTEWGFDLTCVVCGAPVAVEYRPGINQYQTCGKAFVKSRKRKK